MRPTTRVPSARALCCQPPFSQGMADITFIFLHAKPPGFPYLHTLHTQYFQQLPLLPLTPTIGRV